MEGSPIRHFLIKLTDKKQGVADFIRAHPQWTTLMKTINGDQEVWLHPTPTSLALSSFYSPLKQVDEPQPDGYEDIE